MRRGQTGLLVVMLLLAAASTTVAASNAITFKDADLRDVLHTLGDIAGVNVAVDPQVRGTVTIFLQDMDALAALDLIIRTHGYASLHVDNTIVVGPPATLSERFEPVQAKFFPLLHRDPDGLAVTLRAVVPSATVVPDREQKGVLVVGTEAQLEQVQSFIMIRDVKAPFMKDFRNAPVVEVFRELAKEGGYSLLLDTPLEGDLTMLLQGMDVDEAIRLAARQSGVHYRFEGNSLIVGQTPTAVPVEDRDGDGNGAVGAAELSRSGAGRVEAIHTRFFPVRHVDPAAIASALQLVAAPAMVQANASLRGVLVQGTAAQVDAAAAFLREWDVQEPLELDFRDADVLDVFHALAKRGGYSLVVERPLHGTLTMLLQGVDVDDAIRLAARESRVQYRFEGNSLIVSMPPSAAEQRIRDEALAVGDDKTPSTGQAPSPGQASEPPERAKTALTGHVAPEVVETPETTGRVAGGADGPRVPRATLVLPVHYVEAEQLADQLAAGIGLDPADIWTAGNNLFVRGAAEELSLIRSFLAQYDVPSVRLDGLVRGLGTRLAVLSTAARTHIVTEGAFVEGFYIDGIDDEGILLRTAHERIVRVPVGGRE